MARMVCGGQIWSSLANIFFFSAMFSMAASITRSRSPKSSMLRVPLMRRGDGVLLLLGQPALLDPALQGCSDAADALVQELLLDFQCYYVVPGPGADLGYASPHQAAADDADLLDFHLTPFLTLWIRTIRRS